jgi:predicted DNA-binding transcriptional regulator AlpA
MRYRDIAGQAEGNVETITLTEVSQILKISEHTARNRLSLGLPMPPSFRIGRRRLFLKREVERWLAEQAVQGSSYRQVSSKTPTQEATMT